MISAVLVLVISPLLRDKQAFTQRDTQLARQRDRAEVYYQRVLRNLRDLDEDEALGKIAPDEYAVERTLWAQRGVEVLKALDQLDVGILIAAQEADDSAIDSALDRSVEAAVRAYREQQAAKDS
jgi:hypothetical protein